MSDTSSTRSTSTQADRATVARVTELWVFPVKSMAGTRVDRADVTPDGLAGDRSWAVVDEAGATVTAREAPRLREVRPRLAADGLRVDVPGERPGLAPDEAASALSRFLGRAVRLAEQDTGGFADVAPVHVVSTASMSDASHAEECDACDISAPRANLVVDIVGGGSGSERDWVGRTLETSGAGDAALTMAKLPKHCLGVYADVARAGTLSVGDELRG
jgi:uncharacterized protein YcbX